MKKSVRILAMFMAAVVLLSSMAISSLAAASVVESVDINIDVAPGVNSSNLDEYFTINTPGVIFDASNGMKIYDDYNKLVSGEFKKCSSYYFVFYLVPDSGYSWTENFELFDGVTINGNYADSYYIYDEYKDDYILEVNYYVEFNDSVTDIDLTLDVYGEMNKWMYNRYVIFNSYGLVFNDVKFDAVNVYDADGNDVDTFVAGED